MILIQTLLLALVDLLSALVDTYNFLSFSIQYEKYRDDFNKRDNVFDNFRASCTSRSNVWWLR